MDYSNPAKISNPSVQAYVMNVFMDRQLVTMYELEHPKYDTEEDYAHICEAWIHNRSWWTKENPGEYLPKPKRRIGRPVDRAALEAKERRSAERAAERAERAEKKRRSMAARAQGAGAIVVTFKVPEKLMLGILSIKGDLSMAECITQLIEHALAPILSPTEDVKK